MRFNYMRKHCCLHKVAINAKHQRYRKFGSVTGLIDNKQWSIYSNEKSSWVNLLSEN